MPFNSDDDQATSDSQAFPPPNSQDTEPAPNAIPDLNMGHNRHLEASPAQVPPGVEFRPLINDAMADPGALPVESETDTEPSGWEIAKAIIREIFETVALTLIIFFLIQLVIRNFRVDGQSMAPNLQHGQYLVIDKVSYILPMEWRTPQRGDVVVFEPPTHPDKDFVKRIIGLPGETVEIRQGAVYINDEPLDESFGARLDGFSMTPREVPEGQYFVMGDNRANSNDSRNWGALQADKIVGRAWLSYWPPSTWGTIPSDGPTNSATLFYQLGINSE